MLEEKMLREEKKANLIFFGLHEALSDLTGKDRPQTYIYIYRLLLNVNFPISARSENLGQTKF